ncbi:hypothetical protein PybrP1_002027 [[Pythium] brassicae (nom. inval.)]|nr:hypothetical protein PybrP1_002027 [[Pythium] brassicae (nom. inval.)]
MCATTAASSTEMHQRLNDVCCHSPSSITEVDYSSKSAADTAHSKRRKLSCAGSSPASASHHRPSPPSPLQGDPFVSSRDAGAADCAFDGVCGVKDINVALGTSSSGATRKRRLSHSGDVLDDTALNPTPAAAPVSPSPSRSELSRAEQPEPTLSTATEPESDVSAAGVGDASASRDIEPPSPSRLSRRTLYIEYWSRTDECKERKWDHLDAIAEQYGAAEDHIFDTTLRGRTACLEPNMFPYNTPAGIEHWTLWHVNELGHSQIKQYVENWIDANAPHVASWNYDDNPERSIDIFHVHVYLQVPAGATVLQGRAFDDLVHEMD